MERITKPEKQHWMDLPPRLRVFLRDFIPRAPKEGAEEDISVGFDEKHAARIRKVGVAQYLKERPYELQSLAYQLAVLPKDDSVSAELDALVIKIDEHTNEGRIAQAQKGLSYLAMIVCVDIEFPMKTPDSGLSEPSPVLIGA